MNTKSPRFSDEEMAVPDAESTQLIHVQKAQRFMRQHYRPGHPVAVLTLVRDPVARNVSAFFQNIDDHPHLTDSQNPPPIDEFIRTFLDEHDHEFADRWFDFHFKEPFSIDWYEQDFDPEIGHASFAHGKNTYLLLQAELADSEKEQVIREWLSYDKFCMDIRANVGSEKKYAEVYKRFRQEPLPAAYLDRMYGGRVAQRFYSQKQLKAFRARWDGSSR